MGLPSKLTEEEEALLAKFALIKKKKKAQTSKSSHTTKQSESKPILPLLPLKKEPVSDSSKSSKGIGAKKETPVTTPKVPIAPKDAKEKAKQLLASGQLKIGKDNEVRSFKRARTSSNAEKKNDASKSQVKKTESTKPENSDLDLSDLDDDKDKSNSTSSNNFSSKQSIHNKPYNPHNNNNNNNNNNNSDQQKNSFDNHDNNNRFEYHNNRERGRGRGRGRGSHHHYHNNNNNNNNNNYRQNNLFVSGYGLSKEMLERAFAPYGEVKTIYFDQDRGSGFVTYFNNECAAAAIEALHGEMVEGKTLRVVYARRRNNHDKFDDNRYTWRAGRNNRPPTDPERPRDLDSAPGEPSKPPRTMEERISGIPPEKKERKLVNYNDTLITYEDSGGGDFEF